MSKLYLTPNFSAQLLLFLTFEVVGYSGKASYLLATRWFEVNNCLLILHFIWLDARSRNSTFVPEKTFDVDVYYLYG